MSDNGGKGTQTTEKLLSDGDTFRVISPHADKQIAVHVLEGSDCRELEGSLPDLAPLEQLRFLSHVFEVCSRCGFKDPITVFIPHWAVSPERYKTLYVYYTRSVGGKPVLLKSYSADKEEENNWEYNGYIKVKLFEPAAQLFVCGARRVHEAEIVNEHGGTVQGNCRVSVEVPPNALPDGVRKLKIGFEAMGDLRHRPQFIVSPVIGLQKLNFKFEDNVIITLPHSLANANRWNCVFKMRRYDGSDEKIAPFRVYDATASVKIDDLSNVQMCWMEFAVPLVHTVVNAQTFVAGLMAVAFVTRIFMRF